MSLEEHLSGLVAEGEFVETAEFTLNTMKAAQKLSEYQLPSPSLWVVKLVQAAVAFGSPWCKFLSTGRTLTCQFLVDLTQSEADRILHQLLSAQLASEPSISHLLGGIRGSVDGPTQKWSWVVRGPDIAFGVECDSAGIRPIEDFPGEDPTDTVLQFVTERPLKFPNLRKALSLPVKYLVRQTAEEYLSLLSHCWSAPTSLTIDGKPLNGQFRPPSELGEGSWKDATKHVGLSTFVPSLTNYVLARKELPAWKGELHLKHPWIYQYPEADVVDVDGLVTKQKLTFFHETWIDWKQPEDTTVGGHLLFLLGSPLPSRVDWVCDGVIVDSSPLPWSARSDSFLSLSKVSNDAFLSLRVLLPVGIEDLDLSQFRVRNPESKLDAMMVELREEMLATGKLIQEFNKKLKLVGQKRPRHKIVTRLMYDTVSLHGPIRAMVKSQVKRLLESAGDL